MHLFRQQYNIYNAQGVVAQLVRASACHAEGRGFEPRQSRQDSHRHQTVFFLVYYLKKCFIIFLSNIEPKGENMNFKGFAIGALALALMGCNDNTQNPEVLKGLNFVSAQPGADITITFDPNEMRVYGGVVNRYNGGYTADGDNIKFEGFASTMMMGAPEAMETEQEYFEFMPTVERYEYSEGKLTLIATDGKEIIFTQVETLPGEVSEEQPQAQ